MSNNKKIKLVFDRPILEIQQRGLCKNLTIPKSKYPEFKKFVEEETKKVQDQFIKSMEEIDKKLAEVCGIKPENISDKKIMEMV